MAIQWACAWSEKDPSFYSTIRVSKKIAGSLPAGIKIVPLHDQIQFIEQNKNILTVQKCKINFKQNAFSWTWQVHKVQYKMVMYYALFIADISSLLDCSFHLIARHQCKESSQLDLQMMESVSMTPVLSAIDKAQLIVPWTALQGSCNSIFQSLLQIWYQAQVCHSYRSQIFLVEWH